MKALVSPEKGFAALPYYRFWVDVYRGSRPVQRMTYIERGLYRELLDECWLEGAIPDDLNKLAEICDCPLGAMAEAWPKLKPRFSLARDGMDGMFVTHPRLESERTDLDKMRVQKRLAGQSGGKAKAEKLAAASRRVAAPHPPLADATVVVGEREEVVGSSAAADASPDRARPAATCEECGTIWEGFHKKACSQWVKAS